MSREMPERLRYSERELYRAARTGRLAEVDPEIVMDVLERLSRTRVSLDITPYDARDRAEATSGESWPD